MIFSSVFVRENHVSHKRYDRDAKIAVFPKNFRFSKLVC